MAFTYEDLKSATFHNNRSFVSDWLDTCTAAAGGDDKNKDQEWIGNLLSVAAYQHSVDVVRCIIEYITPLSNCKGV